MNIYSKTLKFLIYFSSILFCQIKLDINTIPTQVDVLLDGVNLGSSPIRNERIIPGLHKFEINKEGYAPLVYELVVNPSKAIEIDFFLNPIHKCKFKTQEKGLIFELNGKYHWAVDLIRLDLEAGEHQLRVFKTRQLVDEQLLQIDKPETFNYVLQQPLRMSDP